MGEPLVALNDVSFGYERQTQIVNGFSAQFSPGVVYALSGASGCGKSTLLFLLGLLLRPRSGDVTVLGTPCARISDLHRSSIRRQHIGFVFQDALLETSMTVWQNLREALGPRTQVRAARIRADELLTSLALPSGILDRPTLKLSGGQAQRVATARALLKEPEIILADEPTGNLDDRSASLVLDALISYGRRPDRTCIIVTHDRRIVDRVDELVQVGGPCI